MISTRQFTVLVAILISGCGSDVRDTTEEGEALGRTESALCKNALSASEEKLALKLIDDICGDTWCEGDNDFAFDQLTCHRGARQGASGGSCTLRFRIVPRTDDPTSYARTCTTSDFRGFDSLVETASNGYQSLDWDYYLALSECIQRSEADLPR